MREGSGAPVAFTREQVKAVRRWAWRGESQRLVTLLALLGRQEPTARARELLVALLERAEVVAEPKVEEITGGLTEVRLAFASRWRRLWARKVVRAGWVGVLRVAALLNLAAAVIAVSAVLIDGGSDEPDRGKLAGDLTVAVAPLAVTGGSPGIGAEVARTAQESLRRRLTELEQAVPLDSVALQTDIRGPDGVASVVGRSSAARAERAQQIAEELNADILTYGSIRFTRGRTRLRTELFVRPRALPDAPELSGTFPTSGAVTFRLGRNARAVRSLLASTIVEQARWVGALSLALGWFQVRRLPEARAYLRLALRSGQRLSPAARGVLELIRGNIAALGGDLDAADQSYRRSLTASPSNSRALFGRAEVAYQRARGRCQRGRVTPAGLDQALRRFRLAASRATDATVLARARLGQAKASICLSEAGAESRYAAADRALRLVIRAYDSGDDRLQEEASEAHGFRGLIQLVPRRGISRRARLRQAAAAYEAAKNLAVTARREAVLTAQRSHVLALLGDMKAARKEYAAAKQLDSTSAAKVGPPP